MMKQFTDYGFYTPDWPTAAHIRACSTTRQPVLHAGDNVSFSTGVYAGLNVAHHVGDDAEQVQHNRDWLTQALELPSEPIWLEQTHSTTAINHAFAHDNHNADAILAFVPPVSKCDVGELNSRTRPCSTAVCAVMTADCLPVLLTDLKGSVIAAVHAGWKGLLHGILENTVAAMGDRPLTYMAWLAPAIGAHAFEVGQEVVDAFVALQSDAIACFTPTGHGTYLADLYALAALRLRAHGVNHIYGGQACTYYDATVHNDPTFYSYRRACHLQAGDMRGVTGRMASLIWFAH